VDWGLAGPSLVLVCQSDLQRRGHNTFLLASRPTESAAQQPAHLAWADACVRDAPAQCAPLQGLTTSQAQYRQWSRGTARGVKNAMRAHSRRSGARVQQEPQETVLAPRSEGTARGREAALERAVSLERAASLAKVASAALPRAKQAAATSLPLKVACQPFVWNRDPPHCLQARLPTSAPYLLRDALPCSWRTQLRAPTCVETQWF